jgi:hypothetical protein
MGVNTRECGLTIYRMERAEKPGRTHPRMRVSIKKDKNTERASTFGPMEVYTVARGSTIKYMVTAHTNGQTVEFT